MNDSFAIENSRTPFVLIDSIAPFFLPYCDGSRQNWSKAPLHRLIRSGQVDPKEAEIITQGFRHYCHRARALGCTAITLDDLSHITLFDFYPYLLSRTVYSCQKLFANLIDIANAEGLEVFITTDIMFWNNYIEKESRGNDRSVRQLFAEAISRLFDTFPAISGVVVRIGETDGVEVNCQFKSQMWIKTPEQCNRWLRELLPLFESADKTLIFRTWGLGAFSIGDLIWNEQTERQIIAGIDSSALILSRKYGQADFFRYLDINERITTSSIRQIVEFQARREYEGFGEFPAYVGWQYESIRTAIQNNPTVFGISVWAQTGGWSHFDRLTLLKNGSLWNELNLVATVSLFTTEQTADEILDQFVRKQFPRKEWDSARSIIQLFDTLINQLWYFKPYAEQNLWFRRLRVPPLLWIFWDTILVNPAIRMVIRSFVGNPEELREVDKLLKTELKMIAKLTKNITVEKESLEQAHETFRLIFAIRGYYLGKMRHEKIAKRIDRYRVRYPNGFRIESDFAPFRLRWITETILFGLLLRKHSRYRLFDRFVLIPLTGWMFPLIKKYNFKRMPDLANRQAVGMELFFR